MAAGASVVLDAPAVSTAPLRAGARGGIHLAYKTTLGTAFQGRAEQFLSSELGKGYEGKAQLILTSPPFPLNRKKNYGNESADKCVEWLAVKGGRSPSNSAQRLHRTVNC